MPQQQYQLTSDINDAKKFVTTIFANTEVAEVLLSKQPFIENMLKDAVTENSKARETLANDLMMAELRLNNEEKYLKVAGTKWEPFEMSWFKLIPTIMKVKVPTDGVTGTEFTSAAVKMATAFKKVTLESFEKIKLKDESVTVKLSIDCKKACTDNWEKIMMEFLARVFSIAKFTYINIYSEICGLIRKRKIHFIVSDESTEKLKLSTTAIEDNLNLMKYEMQNIVSRNEKTRLESEAKVKMMATTELYSEAKKVKDLIKEGKITGTVTEQAVSDKVNNLVNLINAIISKAFDPDQLCKFIVYDIEKFKCLLEPIAELTVESQTVTVNNNTEKIEIFHFTENQLPIIKQMFSEIERLSKDIEIKVDRYIVNETMEQKLFAVCPPAKTEFMDLSGNRMLTVIENNKVIKIQDNTKWDNWMLSENNLSLLEFIRDFSIPEYMNLGISTYTNLLKAMMYTFKEKWQQKKYSKWLRSKLELNKEVSQSEFNDLCFEMACIFDPKSIRRAEEEWLEFKDTKEQMKNGKESKYFLHDFEPFMNYAERVADRLKMMKPNSYDEPETITIFHFKVQFGYYLRYDTYHPTCNIFESHKFSFIFTDKAPNALKNKNNRVPKLDELLEAYRCYPEQLESAARILGLDCKNGMQEVNSMMELLRINRDNYDDVTENKDNVNNL